jgi:chaperonin cofactor prefoldin
MYYILKFLGSDYMDLKEKRLDYAFGLNKEQMEYLTKSIKDGDFYEVGFIDGTEKKLNRVGSTKEVHKYVNFLMTNDEIVKKVKENLEDKLNEKMAAEVEMLKKNIEDIRKEIEQHQLKIFDDGADYIKSHSLEIPDFIKSLNNNDIISIRGNKDFYRKFKKFAVMMGVSVTDFVNYLFYFAMEKLGKDRENG